MLCLLMDLCFARLFILAMIVANWHVKLCFISKKSLRPRRMKLTNCYFPSEKLSTCVTIARFLGRRIVLSRVACSLDSIIAKEIATTSRDGLRQLLWTLFQGLRFGVFRTCLRAIQIEHLGGASGEAWRPCFGQKPWPIFDQKFGRISAKIFGQFSAKTLADFRHKKCSLLDFCFSTF